MRAARRRAVEEPGSSGLCRAIRAEERPERESRRWWRVFSLPTPVMCDKQLLVCVTNQWGLPAVEVMKLLPGAKFSGLHCSEGGGHPALIAEPRGEGSAELRQGLVWGHCDFSYSFFFLSV